MTIIIFVLLGLVVGSFVNVLAMRTHAGKKWVRGRSECDHCHHKLAWYDLVPLVSFAVLRGRCRYCKKAISWQNPIVEAVCGLLFSLLAWHFQPHDATGWVQLTAWSLITICLVAAAIYDLRWQQLPDAFTVSAIVLAVLLLLYLQFAAHEQIIGARLIYTLLFGGTIYLLWLFSGGKWIGDGDIRLAILMGLLFDGAHLLTSIVVSFDLAALVALGLMAAGKKHLGDRIPLGFFMIVGIYVTIFFGGPLIHWYSRLVGLNL